MSGLFGVCRFGPSVFADICGQLTDDELNQYDLTELADFKVANHQHKTLFPLSSPVPLDEHGSHAILWGYAWMGGLLPTNSEGARKVVRSFGRRVLANKSLALSDDEGGVFVLLAFDGRSKELTVCGDPSGIMPFYYCHDRRGIAFSSRVWQLAGALRLEPDSVGVLEQLAFHYTIYKRTQYRNMNRLLVGEVITYSPDSGSVTSTSQSIYSHCAPDDATPAVHAERLWESYCKGADACRMLQGSMGILLSGGFDTRLVAHGIQRNGKKIVAVTLGNEGNQEVEVARRLAEKLDADHRVYTPVSDCRYNMELTTYLRRAVDGSNFPYVYSAALMLREQGAMSISTGFGGESYLGGQAYSLLGSAWSKKKRLLAVIRRQLRLGGVLDTRLNHNTAMTAYQSVRDYHLKQWRRLSSLLSVEWQVRHSTAEDEMLGDIQHALSAYENDGSLYVEQVLERFWIEHHVTRHFGKQELTAMQVTGVWLPTIYHAFLRQCVNIKPSAKFDHGVYLRMVKQHMGSLAHLRTSNIPVALSSPNWLIWTSRTASSIRDDRKVAREVAAGSIKPSARSGWADFEYWYRSTDFLQSYQQQFRSSVLEENAVRAKVDRMIHGEERLYSAQDLINMLDVSAALL